VPCDRAPTISLGLEIVMRSDDRSDRQVGELAQDLRLELHVGQRGGGIQTLH